MEKDTAEALIQMNKNMRISGIAVMGISIAMIIHFISHII